MASRSANKDLLKLSWEYIGDQHIEGNVHDAAPHLSCSGPLSLGAPMCIRAPLPSGPLRPARPHVERDGREQRCIPTLLMICILSLTQQLARAELCIGGVKPATCCEQNSQVCMCRTAPPHMHVSQASPPDEHISAKVDLSPKRGGNTVPYMQGSPTTKRSTPGDPRSRWPVPWALRAWRSSWPRTAT